MKLEIEFFFVMLNAVSFQVLAAEVCFLLKILKSIATKYLQKPRQN